VAMTYNNHGLSGMKLAVSESWRESGYVSLAKVEKWLAQPAQMA